MTSLLRRGRVAAWLLAKMFATQFCKTHRAECCAHTPFDYIYCVENRALNFRVKWYNNSMLPQSLIYCNDIYQVEIRSSCVTHSLILREINRSEKENK